MGCKGKAEHRIGIVRKDVKSYGRVETFCVDCGKLFRSPSIYVTTCPTCRAKIEQAAAQFAPKADKDVPTRVVKVGRMRVEFRGHCPNANLFKYEPIKVKE